MLKRFLESLNAEIKRRKLLLSSLGVDNVDAYIRALRVIRQIKEMEKDPANLEKINKLKFIESEEKLNRLTFILFFIPGTPKDLLTYFVGLTRMTLKDFLAITLFARIPSVVSSTIGGNFIGDEKYMEAVILFVVTGIVSVLGIKIYNSIVKKVEVKAKEKIDKLKSKVKSKAKRK